MPVSAGCKLSFKEESPRLIIRNYLKKHGFGNRLIKEKLTAEIRVSVVIPTYNETGVITRCLQALNEQSSHAFEVIVVDNGSKDDTLRKIKSFARYVHYPLYVIEEPSAGVAIARKRGMDEVLQRLLERDEGFKHVLVATDADTIPPKSWIEGIIREFGNFNGIGGLAGTHGASKEVEKKIYEATGIKNYFNIIPSLIEFFEEKGIGQIKMSGPNSAFAATAYALGGGIRHEIDSNGRPKLSEVNNLGNEIKRYGYNIIPMRCRVIKIRRRELFDIVNNCDDSYFPNGFSPEGRFNVIREDEAELLDFACRNVSLKKWKHYRYKMIYKVLRNFVFQPLASGQAAEDKIREIFTAEEINFFLSASFSYFDFPNNRYADRILENLLLRLEEVLQL